MLQTGYIYVTFADATGAQKALAQGSVEQTLKLTGSLQTIKPSARQASEPEYVRTLTVYI